MNIAAIVAEVNGIGGPGPRTEANPGRVAFLVRLVVQPARLGGQPVRPVDSAAAPAPGLGDAAAAEGPHAELPQGVPHALATRAAAQPREVARLPCLAAVLHHQGEGLGEPDLPARVDVDRRAGPRPGAHEVHATEQGLLLEKRGGTAGAFHASHTTPGG